MTTFRTPAGRAPTTVRHRPASTDTSSRTQTEPPGRRHKLVLRRRDEETLQALLDGQDLPVNASEHVRDNYEFFREQLASADPEVVYRGIARLNVVDVTLQRGLDDPQLIFESLNSTGVDLSQSDLIRNFILMRLSEPEQDAALRDVLEQDRESVSRIRSKYLTRSCEISSLWRHNHASRAKPTRYTRRSGLYSERSAPILTPSTSFLQRLLRFARYYAAFSIGVGAPGSAPRIPSSTSQTSRCAGYARDAFI